MTADELPEDLTLADFDLWKDGPPHGIFSDLRAKCPVHWSPGIPVLPEEEGFWSLTKADDIARVSRDWRTFSSERMGIDITNQQIPIEFARAEFIGMDPPKHDRIKQLFLAGFTNEQIGRHEDWIRQIVVTVLDCLDAAETCDLVSAVSQPVVARVIHRLLGIPEEEDVKWADYMKRYMGRDDPDLNPGGIDAYVNELLPTLMQEVTHMIDARRANPTDDLISVLVHAEIDGQTLSTEEIMYGTLLLIGAGNDSTMATYVSAMKALMENPDQRRLVLDDMSLVPSLVEEALRMFPAFSMMRRTATRDVEIGGRLIKENDKVVMWYPSSNRDEDKYDDPHRFDVTRNPEHQAFGAGGRHFCLGNALARLELRLMIEETLKRYPEMEIVGEAPHAESFFINQVKALPVKLGRRAG
ncbi:cytochrome P450 [Streptomyces broussonetiae]|uniref:Cytochrome P450 n=1 Tax=Streptomyces broussonetiae TaxID=2686304 RepID=A0A6I6MRN6_9ACTN|nr:cytochrome P450 [Streptomyces broussonetiae]QHA03228.1 cytochrome P450 [Streptomyces broussonetiae]